MGWRGRRVWLRITAATMTRRYGSVVAVFPSAVHDDAELGVRFDDGAYTTVRASQKGELWDLAD
jgi:hypothetical protein